MKLLNVILILAIAVTTLGIAQAQQRYTAYTVTGVTQTSANVYSVTVSDLKTPNSKAPIPTNGDVLTITTKGCDHVPGKGGENGVVSNGPLGRSLLFSSGATCEIVNITTN